MADWLPPYFSDRPLLPPTPYPLLLSTSNFPFEDFPYRVIIVTIIADPHSCDSAALCARHSHCPLVRELNPDCRPLLPITWTELSTG
jgi:hypothetical protein